jgi:hypothetical protein
MISAIASTPWKVVLVRPANEVRARALVLYGLPTIYALQQSIRAVRAEKAFAAVPGERPHHRTIDQVRPAALFLPKRLVRSKVGGSFKDVAARCDTIPTGAGVNTGDCGGRDPAANRGHQRLKKSPT